MANKTYVKRQCLAWGLGMVLLMPAAQANTSVVTGFSPNGEALRLVIGTIASANTRVDVAAYTFTSKPVAEALVNALRRGVQVRVVADFKQNSDRYSAITFLANQGVAVRLNDKYLAQHNKFLIVDSVTVQTGSFNYSSAASYKNAENVIVLLNAPGVASDYQSTFDQLWAEGQQVNKTY